jgi:predicted HicB family RNase H-like nuclease
VITVRLPQSLHEALKDEAHAHRTSMNQLCISKLLQFIDGDFVPNDS